MRFALWALGIVLFLLLMANIERVLADSLISLTMPTEDVDGNQLPNQVMGVTIYRKRVIGDIEVASRPGLPGQRLTLFVPRDTGQWYAKAWYQSNHLESPASMTVFKVGSCYFICHQEN